MAPSSKKKTEAVNLPPKKETSRIPTKTQRVSLSAKPQSKTSAIPLRKETVRITLKASPADKAQATGGEAPTPKSMAAPNAPVAPGAPATQNLRPSAPVAPTIPLRRPTGGGAAPAAPTVQLKRGGVPVAPGAAPTTPLTRPGAPVTPGGSPGSPTATQQLPQATVKLKQTQPLSQPPSAKGPGSVPVKRVGVDHEEETSDGMSIAIAAAILILLIAVGSFEFAKGNVHKVDNKQKLDQGWTALLSQPK